ncbi:MAG TPA: glutamate synthase large subunit [Oscillatoriaceae cyanobacterium]
MIHHTPQAVGLYDPRFEHDACGVGFVVDRTGARSHRVLALGLAAAARLSHRGAVDADARSGDGAGVLTQLPTKLLDRELGVGQAIAVGMLFLPRTAEGAARAIALVESVLAAEGLERLAWRQVPLNPEALGEKAAATRPDIRQVVIRRPDGRSVTDFERALFLARRRLEKLAQSEGIDDFYVCSLSSRTIVYKALASSAQLPEIYSDLLDADYETALCVFHQRFSTNTFPSWPLAQPFRLLAHNGEINTLGGNRNWMRAHEANLADGPWNEAEIAQITPVIQAGNSDSGALDGVLELLLASGRDLLAALAMLVPAHHEAAPDMPEDVKAFYAYQAGLMEPWDGPAAIAASDGTTVAACLDRNGLRPARYCVLSDGLVVLGSEAGMLEFPEDHVVERGRLGPGEAIAVDVRSGRVLKDAEIKSVLAARRPYGQWLETEQVRLEASYSSQPTGPDLLVRQLVFGYEAEDLDRLIAPMAQGKEAIGSMGDDTPLAVLSRKPRPLYHYFKQRFAQVTNPPIDSLRETLVMSLTTRLGPRRSPLTETPAHAALIRLDSPVLEDAELLQLTALPDARFPSITLACVFDAEAGEVGLRAALEELEQAAEQAVSRGTVLLVLSDREIGENRAPVPMLLALSCIHTHLLRRGLRLRCALLCEAGDVREEHHLACLIGFGADAVNPYLALETAAALQPENPAVARERYRQALEKGLRKIMAKMGIGPVSAYRGAHIFEAIGLDQTLVARHFEGAIARLGGTGLAEIAAHAAAWKAQADVQLAKLPDWGLFRYRPDGEFHQYNPGMFKAIQQSAKSGAPEAAGEVETLVATRPRTALRDLLDFKLAETPVPLEEVEPVEAIVKRFAASAMSLGALSPEAHATISIAMNRLGARCNSGEGGEEPERAIPLPNGDSASSSIKQVASGRFGVTPAYLTHATDLEIKMAQGSKPGEGGQLPGFKVNAHIARLRHATPGVSLISPPPHHDIYSIEDLAQLIFDLRRVNPRARIGVKLVSEAGVGTVAAGVAKAHAQVIHIGGHDGGTGASPLGSIKHAGLPWELGLAETQQTLRLNGLRDRVALRVDGGLKSARDVMVAALLGADEYGFGTALLVSTGCVMARQCHLNICPVGIATQDEKLRHRYKGTPDQIVNFLTGLAEELRTRLAALGFRTMAEAIGRVDRLVVREALPGLEALLAEPEPATPRRCEQNQRPVTAESLDDRLLERAREVIETHGQASFELEIRNTDRAVGARLAGAIAERHGDDGFTGGIRLNLRGSAGQSFGAFLLDGLELRLDGEANDYVGKGMHGGLIVLRPATHRSGQVILGNTALYGATGGVLFAAGDAGERFAVRNSGGTAVVEGVGDHGCEYMTGGTAIVLGRTGSNFAAGMTGGTAYVLDEDARFAARCSQETVALCRPTPDELDAIMGWVEAFVRETGSPRGRQVLQQWEILGPLFWRVQPPEVAQAPMREPTAAQRAFRAP